MTTQSFPANAVNLFIGTPAEALVGSMTIRMKTSGVYYTTGVRLLKDTNYTVTREWGKMAIERGWAGAVVASTPAFPFRDKPFIPGFGKSASEGAFGNSFGPVADTGTQPYPFLWNSAESTSVTGASSPLVQLPGNSTLRVTAGVGVTDLTARIDATNDALTAAGSGTSWTGIATVALSAAGTASVPLATPYLALRVVVVSLAGGSASADYLPGSVPLVASPGTVIVNPTYTGIPMPSRYILAQSGIPLAKPSSGTMGANGALSGLVQNFARTFPACYLWFPAGAVFSGSAAGFYFAVMSSTTSGTVYNNTFSGLGVPTIPAVPTPIVAAGPGAYTQNTALNTEFVSIPLPGGTLGANGSFVLRTQWEIDNNAGTHNCAAAFGAATEILTLTLTGGSTPTVSAERIVRNVGVQNAQVFFNPNGSVPNELTVNNEALKGGAVDTTITQLIRLYGLTTNATHIVCLTSWSIEILPAA